MQEKDEKNSGTFSLWRLKLVAFLCGAILMSLEMAGVRILNVYFGSTIYVWGAIIGIFLGALSLGYYIGGIVADKKPVFSLLGILIFSAAFFIFLVPVIAKPLCNSLLGINSLDARIQALLGSIILYFIPSVILGMVSPFAVRLAAHEVKNIGHVAGRLYAISTLGSIFGTFITTFVLVEYMGMREIIWALAAVLVFAAILTFRKNLHTVAAVFAGFALALPSYFFIEKNMVSLNFLTSVKEEFDTPYHHIVVGHGRSLVKKGGEADYLLFNTQIQSGINSEEKEKVVSACGYTDMLHLGMLFNEKPVNRILVIGCGGGIGPMVFRQDYPDIKKIDVVDIDRKVFETANKYFRYPVNDEIITSHVTDGRRFVRNSPENYYDYIILDAYSSGGRVPFHLLTKEFFEMTDKAISNDGILVINLISAIDGEYSRLFKAVKNTLDSVFKKEGGCNIYVFPRLNYAYHENVMNICLVCTKSGRRLSANEIINNLKDRHGKGIIKRNTLRDFVNNLLPESSPQDAVLITDNYAPLDSMTRR